MLCDSLDHILPDYVARYEREQVCVLTDERVERLCGLPTCLRELPVLRLAMDESHKTIERVAQIWDFLFEHGITRHGLLICIGGGVLTDMGGFAASTYKRGIDYLNIPTTLLAMIDASSGGKTGINYHGLKNSIGVFAPPVATLIWPGWLKTLPAQEMLSGFGEMLKTGLVKEGRDKREEIRDKSLWSELLRYDLDTMPLESLTPLIEACVDAKERIVTADPKEEGLRKVLNFGHTFGHALEEVSIQKSEVRSQMLHGYAVLYGMIAELYLSVVKLGYPKEPLQQLTQLMIHTYGRPQCNCSNREQLVRLMQQDKKNERTAEINCTLLRDIGSPVINQRISEDEAKEALEYLFSL